MRIVYDAPYGATFAIGPFAKFKISICSIFDHDDLSNVADGEFNEFFTKEDRIFALLQEQLDDFVCHICEGDDFNLRLWIEVLNYVDDAFAYVINSLIDINDICKTNSSDVQLQQIDLRHKRLL